VTLSEESVLHFPLSRLGAYKKDVLFSDKATRKGDEFVLALALIYNDLKASLLFWEINKKFSAPRPEAGKVCKYFGQSVGIWHYCFRVQVGIIVELLELMKRNDDLFSLPLWKKVLKGMSSEPRKQWKDLIRHFPRIP
jgi:hypothetical protein